MKYLSIALVLVMAGLANAQAAAPVTVTQDDAFFTLDNGIIKALVSKKSGDIVSMKFRDREMFATLMKEDGTIDLDRDPPGDPGRGRGMTDHMYGFWSHDTIGPRVVTAITIDPKSNNGDRAEVSVKGFSDGHLLGHGPGAPQGEEGQFAADIDIRYALGRGDQGIYTYCTFDHKPEYPMSKMGEARFCTKLSEIFDWMLVDDRHNQLYPRELEQNGDNKYNYTTVQWEHPAFGWASTSQNTGFFIVNASVEYLTGPPTKVEFVCHRDTSGPLYAPTVLNYWRSSHYGGGGVDVIQGEPWTKVIGPIMLYCNTGVNPQVIWADAQAQQKKEVAKWPYDWVNGVDYPHKDQRSTVSGQLVLTDPKVSGATMSNVRVGLAYPDYRVTTGRESETNAPADLTWQTDSKHYSFWVRGDNDGTFSIPAVRAGKYTLHAFAEGVLGEYAKADITVEAGKPLNLGKLVWTPVRHGRQLWEIGIPNRTGAEYVKGLDHYHDNMEMVYSLLFPNDVNYTIGKSDFSRDWFYLHVPHATDSAIATATVNAQPRRGRGGFGGGAPGAPGAGPATQPGGGFARGAGRGFGRGAATQPGGAIAGGAAPDGAAPATQPVAGGFARGARRGGGGAPGGPGGGAPGTRPAPWTVTFDMPSSPRGKATLRLGIATNNNAQLLISVNGAEAGRLAGLPSESSIGRNANRGIWFEREVPFDASMLKAGTNTLTITNSAGGIIYDYIRLELDDSAVAIAN